MKIDRVLITGFSGFVSRHFLRYLEDQDPDVEVLGIGRNSLQDPPSFYGGLRCSYRAVDMLDKVALGEAIGAFRPTHVLHLAAYSSVGFSWHQPLDSFSNNTNIFLNLLEQVRNRGLECRVLSVGSSEEYGDVEAHELPLRESAPVRPASPYAVARVAQEMLSRVYVSGYGLDIVMTRSFNHIGTHQREAFLVPSLVKQVRAIRKGAGIGRLITGDRSIVRDFIDVRDVVRAYYALLLHGKTGDVYNVCSGRAVSIDELIDTILRLVGVDADRETDPRLVRPNDNRRIVGSYEKLHCLTGWEPEVTLQDSLRQILEGD